MPVSFGPSQVQPPPAPAAAVQAAIPSVAPALNDATPRTTQFFADRTRAVLIGDQGAIGRWGQSGNLAAALSQEPQEQDQPPIGGNPLAMRFRAVHQKPSSDSEQVALAFLLVMVIDFC
jgi:hypothetical protein